MENIKTTNKKTDWRVALYHLPLGEMVDACEQAEKEILDHSSDTLFVECMIKPYNQLGTLLRLIRMAKKLRDDNLFKHGERQLVILKHAKRAYSEMCAEAAIRTPEYIKAFLYLIKVTK